MNTSTRLRQLADRMGLDGFAEDLREIAGELEAKAAPAVPQGDLIKRVAAININFEKWATDSKQGYCLTREDRGLMATYFSDPTEHAWRGYCAAALAAPSQEPVTLTDRQFDLICQAIDKADTITMDGDYMMDSGDCIAVVRVMQALFDIAALREKQAKATP